ncbi:MAG: nitroreductase family protein [Muribaculaceae bacterium]|nr:nitroreductase family protein [Muribaculaceae bacterium]
MTYTDFLELVNSRYSCRNFSDKRLSKDTIGEILETARLAPSACNKQPWKFIVITTKENRDKIAQCYSRDWIKSASAYILALGHNEEAWHRADDNKDHTDVDLAIAIEHICLAATSLGVGSCWVCNFDVSKCKTLFGIGERFEPIAIIPLGYPSDETIISEKKRKAIDEIVEWDTL